MTTTSRHSTRRAGQAAASSGQAIADRAPDSAGQMAASSGQQAPPEPIGAAQRAAARRAAARQASLQQAARLGHSMVDRGAFAYCRTCAKVSQQRFAALAKPCPGPTNNARELAHRTADLKHLKDGNNPRSGKKF